MYDYVVDRNLNQFISVMSPTGFSRGILRPYSCGDQIWTELNFRNQQRGGTEVNSSVDLSSWEIKSVWECKKMQCLVWPPAVVLK